MLIWNSLSPDEKSQALMRPAMSDSDSLKSQVTKIIAGVQTEGDAYLKSLALEFDGIELESLVLNDLQSIAAQLDSTTRQAIDMAYDNIHAFHLAQTPNDIRVETRPGVCCELKYQALQNVGLYIPGGSAPLPSTLLMTGIPAQIAGCEEIVVCTPPSQQGLSPAIAYAASKIGVRKICLVGGAQAIAAMAYGTESVTKVDKIFGPGNAFVTQAKQQVSQDVKGAAIDMPAGPSEVLVLADDQANPEFIAADLLSQAEHGPDSQVLCVSPSQDLLAQVKAALARQIGSLSRQDIATLALENARLILTSDLEQAIRVTNAYGPEHLIVQTQDPQALANRFTSAASIFLGAYTPESAGDYASGTNHVLPTYGWSKTQSSLSLQDYFRSYTVQQITPQGLTQLADAILPLAQAEGLDAHANAVAVRLAQLQQGANL